MSQADIDKSWLDFVPGKSKMLDLIRSRDWSDTPLGKPATWPRSLQVALDVILHSGYPMFIWWGPELIMFHNDAYLPVLGQKHPGALGRSARDVWSEIWDQVGEIVENVFKGEEFNAKDLLMYLDRKGFSEETYWTFSYSPFHDAGGEVLGLFCACNEETEKIQRQRRLNCIKNISALNLQCKDLPSLYAAIIEELKVNSRDIRYAALYLLREGTTDFERVAHGGSPDRSGNYPKLLSTSPGGGGKTPGIRQLIKSRSLIILDELPEELGDGRQGNSTLTDKVALAPLLKSGQQEITGLLFCELSPFLELNDDYRNFLTLIAVQISSAIADVRLSVEERRQEEELKASEKRFRELADNVPVIIWVTDVEGNCMYTNKPWTDYSGQELRESKGTGWMQNVHPEDKANTSETFFKANQNQQPFSLTYRMKDRYGNYYWHIDNGLPKYDAEGKFSGFIGVVYNIHERKLAEEKLQEQEEKLRLAVEATHLGTWDYYPLEGKLYWSAICKDIFGIPPTEEMSYEKFLHALHEADRERTDQSVQAALAGKEHYDIEYRVIRKTDGEERWIKATGESYLNENNEAYRFVGTVQDITDRKLAEQQKNDFLRIAGHELRTPLTSIVGYLGLLQRMIGAQDQARPFIDKSLQSSMKMKSLISDFLDISRVERGELAFTMERVHLSAVVEETILGGRLPGDQYEIDLNVEPNLYIYGDKARLEQVILNLLSNARKYSLEGGIIKVSLAGGNNKVFFRIQDKGIGMEQEEVTKIFRKFYRGASGTKIKGMGLGLYIVKKIVDFHEGEIRVQTVPDKGTLFTLEFPLVD